MLRIKMDSIAVSTYIVIWVGLGQSEDLAVCE